MRRVEGKVAIITGAGTGMGRAAMLLFAREGARVVGAGRTQATLDAALAEVTAAGGDGTVVRADVSTEEGCERVVRAAVEAYSGIDILLNNAGIGWDFEAVVPGSMAGVAETTPAAFRAVMQVNLESAFLMSRLVIPEMRKRGGGVIVNNASIGGLGGLVDAHAYTASKAGMINMSRSMAAAYGPQNIRTNCIAPGLVDTKMMVPFNEATNRPFEREETKYQFCPLGRAGTPEEMALGMLFLAGEGTYCNGTVLLMDGGSTARAL